MSEEKPSSKKRGFKKAVYIIAILFVALILIAAIFGDESNTSNEAKNDTEEATETEEDTRHDVFDVSVDTLPSEWNEAVDALGAGYTLPGEIEANLDEFGGFKRAEIDVGNGSTVFISWSSENQAVSEIEIDGQTTEENTSTDLTASAAAMVYTTSERSISESENFVNDELMSGTSNLEEDDVINNLAEEEGVAYRFVTDGTSGFGTWTASAQP